MKVIFASIALVVALSGCSGALSSGTTGTALNSGAELSEAQLKAIMLQKMTSDCDSLNEFVLTPSNWETSTSSDGATEFILYGDGGALALNVIPDGAGSANVVIADSNYATTNTNLFYSGCLTLATDPEPQNSDPGNTGSNNQSNQQPSGHYEQVCKQVSVPNPQWNANAGPGVMSMKGISQFMWQEQCSQVWVQ